MAGDDDEDTIVEVPRKKNGAVSDDDVRELLAAERAKNAQLTERIATERVERNRAEAIARTSTDARFDAEGAAVEERLAGAAGKAKDLKKALAEAMAEGRFEEVAEIQDQLAELRAKEQHDKQYKTWLEGEKERAAARAKQQQGTAEVDLSNLSAAQRKWVKANPRFMEDEAFRKRTEAGHALAIAEGIEVDSPEYFDLIDDLVAKAPQGRQRQKVDRVTEEDGDEEVVIKPRARERDLGTDTPPTRSSPRTREDRQTVRISSEQREAADITLPTYPTEGYTDQKSGVYVPSRYEKYAMQLKALKASGRM